MRTPALHRDPVGTSLATLLIVCGLQFPVFGQGQPAPLRGTRLDVVFSASLFRTVNRNDATAAIRVWASMFAQTHGFQLSTTLDVADDVAGVRRRVLAGSVGVLGLDVVEYFQLADLAEVEPVFWALGEGNAPPRWLLLVGSESGISSLEGLRAKTAIIYAKTGANLGQVWLDAMLYDGRLGRPDRFLRSVDVVAKASSAILPVFFGKADAAVVDEPSFDVAKEMNPQLGVKLRVLTASPPLPEGILCICRNRLEFREEFVQDMQELQRDPQGRQMLMVFRFSRLAPVDIPALMPLRQMWRKHTLLFKPTEKASVGNSSRQETHLSGRGEAQ